MTDATWRKRWGPRWEEVKRLCWTETATYRSLVAQRQRALILGKRWTDGDVERFLDAHTEP